MALDALPYAHKKPGEAAAENPDTRGSSAAITEVRSLSDAGPAAGTGSAAARDNTRSAQGSPLDFLLNVMRAPDTPTTLRSKVARKITPFIHERRVTGRSSEIKPRRRRGKGTQPRRVRSLAPDECGFAVDPEVARELRDAKQRLARLGHQRMHPDDYTRRATKLQVHIERHRKRCNVRALPPTAWTVLPETSIDSRYSRATGKRAYH